MFKVIFDKNKYQLCDTEEEAEKVCEENGLDPEYAILIWG
jgi:hypothetical protein